VKKPYIFVLCLIAVCAALALIGGSTPEPDPELELAPIYQATLVKAEIKTQAPAPAEEIEVKPEKTEEVVKKEEDTSGTIKATITHYCACSSCNGIWSYEKDGANYTETASGIILYDGISGNYCAATFGKLGDIVTINGVDYEIVDRMGGNSGKRIDIFVAAGHDKCNELGRYTAEVKLKG